VVTAAMAKRLIPSAPKISEKDNALLPRQHFFEILRFYLFRPLQAGDIRAI